MSGWSVAKVRSPDGKRTGSARSSSEPQQSRALVVAPRVRPPIWSTTSQRPPHLNELSDPSESRMRVGRPESLVRRGACFETSRA